MGLRKNFPGEVEHFRGQKFCILLSSPAGLHVQDYICMLSFTTICSRLTLFVLSLFSLELHVVVKTAKINCGARLLKSSEKQRLKGVDCIQGAFDWRKTSAIA